MTKIATATPFHIKTHSGVRITVERPVAAVEDPWVENTASPNLILLV